MELDVGELGDTLPARIAKARTAKGADMTVKVRMPVNAAGVARRPIERKMTTDVAAQFTVVAADKAKAATCSGPLHKYDAYSRSCRTTRRGAAESLIA